MNKYQELSPSIVSSQNNTYGNFELTSQGLSVESATSPTNVTTPDGIKAPGIATAHQILVPAGSTVHSDIFLNQGCHFIISGADGVLALGGTLGFSDNSPIPLKNSSRTSDFADKVLSSGTNLNGGALIALSYGENELATIPANITNFVATGEDSNVNLTWDASINSDTYEIQRSTTSGTGFSVIATIDAETSPEYDDNTAINGTPYYYLVRGINENGNKSALSSEETATPSA